MSAPRSTQQSVVELPMGASTANVAWSATVGPALATGLRPDLTPREQDVLALVVTGLSYAQIARSLFVTQSTVGFHLSKLHAKFAVASRHELTALVRLQPDVLTTLGVVS